MITSSLRHTNCADDVIVGWTCGWVIIRSFHVFKGVYLNYPKNMDTSSLLKLFKR